MKNSVHIQDILPIAVKAGAEILRIYEDITYLSHIENKEDHSPLTLADRAAHRVIEAGLQEITPTIPILSEEGKHLGYEIRREWDRLWIVDPLDGTKEFIKRNGEFTVNIALVENGYPILGVVYVPVTDVLYFAAKGQGAFKEVKGVRTALTTRKFSSNQKGLRVVSSRSHISRETEDYMAQFQEPELKNMGSSLKFMLIAEGEADIYPRFAPTSEWDTAAAQMIVEEAGGSVCVANSESRLHYNKETLLNPYFIAKGMQE
jgi:3'(2'), 5'-bisphosphate nucleotidase